jgi:hypothetical protein
MPPPVATLNPPLTFVAIAFKKFGDFGGIGFSRVLNDRCQAVFRRPSRDSEGESGWLL